MAAEPSETSVVEYECRIGARPETVFAYFTDPARMVRWIGAEATLDPRPGGVCRIVFRPTATLLEHGPAAFGLASGGLEPGAVSAMLGRFVEVDPPRRIVLTWGWERELYAMPPQSTVVEVSLTPDGASTILHLVHRRLPSEARDFHRAGWRRYLARLAAVAVGRDPGPDSWSHASATRAS